MIADLHRKLLTIRTIPACLHAAINERAVARGQIPREAVSVLLAKFRWDEQIRHLATERLLRISEYALRRRIEGRDHSAVIHTDDGVRRRIKDGPRAPLFVTHVRFDACARDELTHVLSDRGHRIEQVVSGVTTVSVKHSMTPRMSSDSRIGKANPHVPRRPSRPRSRKVGIPYDVFNPRRTSCRPHASGKPDTCLKQHLLGGLSKWGRGRSAVAPDGQAPESLNVIVNEPERRNVPLERLAEPSQNQRRSL